MAETQSQNRIHQALEKPGKLLSIYYTAGFPNLEDTVPILEELQAAGADMVEIGLPFSDPLADGPTIQESSTRALRNGMHTELLFEQLKDVRKTVDLPLILMGYFNPVLQYGVEAFCRKCKEVGIDGLILPDLPLEIYQRDYQHLMAPYGLSMVFLISPQTGEARIRQIDAASDSFIYMVSSASTTGVQDQFGQGQDAYFDRIHAMELKHPQVVGFGISDAQSFQKATRTAKGAIIGSAFIRLLEREGLGGIRNFIENIRP
ncbi:tryptophan synthase subunit alpha [Robiginitalea sp. M366]|uniref:tryptophan synthase subunit alpha n=1 Tax=Robiginitalea aestuariiviva TaxID=3036903 RepID=UPI00240D533C|nr:tryptophan synthase subunit alpha [Robiginitalea aestuariiviva]MDG1570725.1 tryptophan synthase subunit alpha [Robiginitalea aestuariiviva]